MTTVPSTRPRYGRIGLLAGAVLVTLVTVLGGLGVLPSGGAPAYAGQPDRQSNDQPDAGMALTGDSAAAPPARSTGPSRGPSAQPMGGSDSSASRTVALAAERLPADTGEGRRVVFDMSAQRVWLVGGSAARGDRVRRTYLVSGSLTDNLAPGSYTVYSRSARAWGVDDSGSMEFMVRFARGERAAIGFHSIPVKDGVPLQSEEQLGTPQSHGCIRQARPDAKALWDFAPVGTPVVVTA
jgi:hypothetical protein